ncbi:hypothetical protein K2173_002443 [Erythroxylum novogranatense]|uniref:Sulfotransferase n=1 Tax=Erythroxylum novogranatense TaxID=1862640 RepID=A0AAV8TBL2_9ROSI|nr:hypothetical protein K2173_002443 [Erythroxylum novogranatense]
MATWFAYHKIEASNESQSYKETIRKYDELVQTLPGDDAWWTRHLYKGFWLPSGGLIACLLLEDHHFHSKPTDILVASSPKCGTTWIKALIFASLNRNIYDFVTHPLITTNPHPLVPFLEKCLRRNENTDSLPSPRLFATHLPYTFLPDYVKDSGCKFVYICRNPKDAFVSMWLFLNKVMSRYRPTEVSLQDAFEMFTKGASIFGPFWDHVLSYWNASLEAPYQVLFVMYENLQREPVAQVKRLAEFLDTPFSMEEEKAGVIQDIVKLCSFDNLNNLEVNKVDSNSDPSAIIKNSDFFRKGKVGDWKNYLTPEMAACLDQITAEKLRGSGLSFIDQSV